MCHLHNPVLCNRNTEPDSAAVKFVTVPARSKRVRVLVRLELPRQVDAPKTGMWLPAARRPHKPVNNRLNIEPGQAQMKFVIVRARSKPVRAPARLDQRRLQKVR